MTYLEDAAAILNTSLADWNKRAIKNSENMRAEILDARLRIAEGFARLAAVEREGTPASAATPSALTARVEEALEVAQTYGGYDGAHHKNWVIDQMVRALTGCPVTEKAGTDHQGHEYTYEARGESDWYLRVVHEAGEWDEGIAP